MALFPSSPNFLEIKPGSGASLKHVMDQVGHKTPSMTLSVYSRVTKEAGKQAQENLQRYVFG